MKRISAETVITPRQIHANSGCPVSTLPYSTGLGFVSSVLTVGLVGPVG